MTELKLLTNGALHMVDKEFREGEKSLDKNKLSRYVESPEFSIDIDNLLEEIDRVQNNLPKDIADKELAPIVHRELDLTRRQASNSEIWNYLSIYEAPDFVRYRWGGDSAKNRWIVRNRSKQSLNRQAFSSLWWLAEITHSEERGYEFTRTVFESQEFKNWIMGPSYGRNEQVVNAMISELHDIDSDQYRQVLKVFTAIAATFSIDAMNEKELRRLISEIKKWKLESANDTSGSILSRLFGR